MDSIIRIDLSSVWIEETDKIPKKISRKPILENKKEVKQNISKQKKSSFENQDPNKNKYGLHKSFHLDNDSIIEIGVDEAGRGPLFGRLYVAAVVLPKDNSFDFREMRDSKKITSKKKITELSEYIKQHSEAWYIHYIEADEIDQINIRQAVLKAMRECIRHVSLQIQEKIKNPILFLMIDGNDFPPYIVFDEETNEMKTIPHETIPGGDNLYVSIACASILAKVERDRYMMDLCDQYPKLKEKYGLDTNMGYGTKEHMSGIEKYGISQWHRRTYGKCKESRLEFIEICTSK